MYKNNFKEESIHQTRFETVQITDKFIDSAAHIELVIALVNQVRKLKSENKLSLKTDLETLKIYSDNIDVLEILKNNQQVFSGITRAKSIEYISGNLEADSLFSENSLWIAHVFVG
jgi:valyl-tRNA synthetase